MLAWMSSTSVPSTSRLPGALPLGFSIGQAWAQRSDTPAVAEAALKFFGQLYDVEREVRDLDAGQRLQVRQAKARPIADAMHDWMRLQRQKITNGSASAKALDYSLKRWVALTRYLDDGQLPIDNNWIENQIRPWAIGRS